MRFLDHHFLHSELDATRWSVDDLGKLIVDFDQSALDLPVFSGELSALPGY